MQEEQRLQSPQLVPTVEVHPIKLCYSLVCHDYLEPPMSPSGAESHDGFVLVSQDESAVDTLHSLMKVAAPQKASSCVRIWSQRATIHTSRYEAIHLEDLEVPEHSSDFGATSVDMRKRQLTVGEWLSTHAGDASQAQLKMLVETRKTGLSEWPREDQEFENRVKVGDFVDAQDSSSKWYESVVREITEDTVTVHYLGWASKWDSTLKRRRNGKAVEGIMQVSAHFAGVVNALGLITNHFAIVYVFIHFQRLQEPAPLWTKTSRWRERIRVGDTVEVRDSSSLASRPRWYRGEVKEIGRPDDPVRECSSGAELEEYVFDGQEKGPLQLLGQKQQVSLSFEVQCSAQRQGEISC